MKKLRVGLLTLLLCSLPLVPAQAIEFALPQVPEAVMKPIAIGFDALLIRPMAAVYLLVGAAALGPALLISLPNGETTRSDAIEIFVTVPYEELVLREIGDLG